jgi:hypothetical protein
MSHGRAAAQASHASNAFIHKFGRTTRAGGPNVEIEAWQKETLQGFGTAIILTANNEQIDKVIKQAGAANFPCDTVIDPDYVIPISSEILPFLSQDGFFHVTPSPSDPFKYLLHRSEMTCAYVFGDKEKLKDIVGHLPLY